MKKTLIPFISLLFGTFCITSCSSKGLLPNNTGTNNSSDTSIEDGEDPELNEPGINNTILHCFDWSLNNIRSNLSNIKQAGFNKIQISPMQPQKDPYNGNWKDQWWKLYQPLGFSVATSGQNILGTKSDLISLCSEADQQGIDIIVDVVANHLASESKNLSSSVQSFEPEIYNNNLIHQTGKSIDEDVIRGNMGDLCDLKTEDSRVQNRVLSLLKEYVDCGIDGFRFDAAKHIETEFDTATYKSDFWKNTLDVATSYAKTKYSKDLFSYGEILGTVGEGREYSYYTCRMGITDSDQGSMILHAARGDVSVVSSEYNTKEKPSSLVLWAESHDTYSNSWGESKDDSLATIQKGYVMQASRRNAAQLYFARPNSSSNLGDVGDTSYRNNEVKAINTFREKHKDKKDNVSTSNGCFVNVRGSSAAVVVRLEGNNTQIEVSGLANGQYKDLITNNMVTVSDGVVNFPSGSTYLILDSDNEDVVMPSLKLSYNEVYSSSQNVEVTVKNSTSTTYSINGGTEQTLSGNNIALPNSLSNGRVSLRIKAKNDNGMISKEIKLLKTDHLVNKELIITDCDTSFTYFLWTWTTGEGVWRSVTVDGNMIGCDLGTDYMFILVKFNSGTTTANWDNKQGQSGDTYKNKRIYSFSEFTFE